MFGKGSKEQSAPEVPWALQFLTTEYLVAGIVQPDDYQVVGQTSFWDDRSRQAAPQAYKDYRQPLPAVFYAGPYVVLARYLSDPSAGNILFRDEHSLRPLAGAEIDCQLPGSKLKGWRVP
jgi:hypothetical protein